jgi:acyl carrier protein
MFEKVAALIETQLPVKADQITRESRLVQDLGADSANIMILIMELEDQFGIIVEDDMLSDIKTVGDVVDYLETRVG